MGKLTDIIMTISPEVDMNEPDGPNLHHEEARDVE